METKIYSEKQIKEVAEFLISGEVVCFPTETVFGLGVVFDNEEAFAKLVAVKRRPADKPFTLMCADLEDIEKYAKINSKTKEIIKQFMPGPLTIIVDVHDNVPSWVTLNTGSIGIRISSLDLVRNLIRQCGKPLLVPSANRAGETPAYSAEEAYNIFAGDIPAIIDGVATSHVPSTIIKISKNELTLIRQGTISFEEIKKIWED
ncbi:MAG: threonylcarbamoyl-AMP synthase [Bacilli bacterium]|jgi:L-threonylcarbamoyladenylate synthase|nr:threonylcarbamoyl-AMP synthase [Bacilli bacterium]MCH4201524.1 threonylcarbamoyl-AMP synthase [Bacilli bacterium]MCH4235664.1 threonylcarbamoyl-AMP synthase [Bacilli bacterium]